MTAAPRRVPEDMIDFRPLRRRDQTLADLAEGLDRDALVELTTEMCDLELQLIVTAQDADVSFVPEDADADDRFAADEVDRALAWTLGHVVVHAAASSEEAAAHALTLARGLPVEGRSRYEVPWQGATTVAFLRDRIGESRRMRLAMLGAWPDRPHLGVTWQPNPGRPQLNAISTFVSGLAHEDSHLDQIRRVLGQAEAARGKASVAQPEAGGSTVSRAAQSRL